MSYDNRHNISEFNGRTIVSVDGLEAGSDQVSFTMADGTRWRMLHVQDCCEGVSVEDVIGDVDDLIGGTVFDAREECSSDTHPVGFDTTNRYIDSFTWTFYIIQTNKGAVTIRWLGESNGYYSEGVDLEQDE